MVDIPDVTGIYYAISINPWLIRYLLQYPQVCYSYCEIYHLYHITNNQIYAAPEYLDVCYFYHQTHNYYIVVPQLNNDIIVHTCARQQTLL